MSKILIFSLLVFSTLQSFGESPFNYSRFERGGDTMQYRIMYPEDFDENKKYPLTIFLHGSGENGLDNEKQLIHGSKFFIENRSKFPAIVIFPQCPPEGYWANLKREETPEGLRFSYFYGIEPSQAMNMLIGLIDEYLDKDFIDKERVSIGGLSMGGLGTFEILYRRPEVFAAAYVICGGGIAEFAENYNKNLSLWVFHGAKDDVISPMESQVVADAARDKIKEVKYTLYPNANYNSWDPAFAEPEFLPWLYSRKLEKK